MSGDVLGLIDNAIEAAEVSADAMRWAPEPPEPRSAAELYGDVFNLPPISFGFQCETEPGSCWICRAFAVTRSDHETGT